MEIPVPPVPEQRRIVEYLDGLAGQVAALARLQSETAFALDALLHPSSTKHSKENCDMAGAKKRAFPLSQVYRLLGIRTGRDGHDGPRRRANIMTMSWHTMMEFERRSWVA